MSALVKERSGFTPRKLGGLDLPMKAGAKIFKGAFVVMLAGYVAQASAALALKPVGKASDTVDNTGGADGDVTCHVEFPSEKTFMPFIGDPAHLFVQSDMGNKAYILDDQTVTTLSTGHSVCGTPWQISTANSIQTVWVELQSAASEDLEARVEALETDVLAAGIIPSIQTGRAALVAGVLTVNAGVTIAAGSKIFASRSLAGGTPGVELRALSADRTNGAPGVGVFKVRSFDDAGAAQTLDTSTVEYLIVG